MMTTWKTLSASSYPVPTETRKFFWKELMGKEFDHPQYGTCFAMYDVNNDKIFIYGRGKQEPVSEVNPIYLKPRSPGITRVDLDHF